MSDEKRIKLVITHPSEFSERWEKYYCLDELSKSFDVEWWDCSEIVTSFTCGKVPQRLDRSYVKKISSLSDFKIKMSQLPYNSILITEIHYNKFSYPIHKIQSSYFSSYVHINFYANTQLHFSQKSKTTEKDEHTKTSVRTTIYKRLKGFLYRIFFIQEFFKYMRHHNDSDYENQKAIQQIYRMYEPVFEISSTENCVHRINHPDYEQYLKNRNEERKENTILFIDNYFPNHPEISCNEQNFNIKLVEKLYYESLNSFFNSIEKEYKSEVVIAAHPSAIYKQNPFGGRKLYWGNTAELVRDARMVCMHTSNAFSYVVLYNKPVALITNVGFRMATFQQKRLEYCSEQYNLPIVDIDDSTFDVKKTLFHTIDDDIRQSYINHYLGDTQNEEFNSSLLKKYLLEYYNEKYGK